MKVTSLCAATGPLLVAVLIATGAAAVFAPTKRVLLGGSPPAVDAAPSNVAVEDAPCDDEPERLPKTLSELGLFSDLSSLEVAEGVATYEVRQAAWRDGATSVYARRLPEGRKLRVDAEGRFQFPVGSLFAQTLSTPDQDAARPIETRVLLKTSKRWLVGTYVWEGSDAEISKPFDRPIPKRLPHVDEDYVVPGRVSCLQCHAGAGDMVVGFSPFQLGVAGLDELVREGVLSPEDAVVASLAAAPPAVDANEAEAVEYLAANCAHCHNPEGSAYVGSRLDLRPRHVLDAIGREASRLMNAEARRVVVPGSPETSTLFRLFTATLVDGHDASKRMPPTGAVRVDPRGVEILERWIRSMPPGRAPGVARSE
jgi:hypothetical protein